MLEFVPEGPWEIERSPLKRGKLITKANVKTFWTDHPDIPDRIGCYLFATRAGKGFTPWYAGKATMGFRQEVFTADKLGKYHLALGRNGNGTPVLLFFVAPRQKGARPTRLIEDCEEWLIHTTVSVNPDALNVQGREEVNWCIRGVVASGAGKPSDAAVATKRVLKL